MHADLSRDTFRPDRHYAAVLAQQGRVQLDADANEQAAIQLHRARTTTADLIGQHGGPRGATGFEVGFLGGSRELDDLSLGGGRYYVDGILLDATRPEPGVPADEDAEGDAEAPATWTYWDQPDGYRDPERPGDRLPTRFPYLACLKVWERSVTAAEDPLLREVALGPAMPDTAARVKTVWQVLPVPGSQLELEDGATKDQVREAFARWSAAQAPTARMAARSERPEHADEDPCLVDPDARYRGPENQMYRVEIHEGGPAEDATFKWSRENGSVTLPVDGLDGTWVELASLGNDDKLGLTVGDQVEFVDTGYTSRGEPLPLLRIEEIDLPGRRVRLSEEPHPSVGRRPGLHPYLRRWDQRPGTRHGGGPGRTKQGAAKLRNGAVRVEEGGWLPLEDGVFVYFERGRTYRSGDYWTVPARTATGGVEWPTDAARRPLLRSPEGIRVHYAPLAWVLGEGSVADLRMTFAPLAAVVPAADEQQLAAEATAEEEARAAEAATGSDGRTAGQDDEGQSEN
ncbi:DUF6519 domain-containing protein [Streptomyces sp. QL37]|uniref:DUF6519 domain-containing protein n=1 Tax=Streptomyces sp. QL37 TaxID=2093747 RepID=UPI000CF2AEEC|nr:DUF6519 domain-containing protein [Streptomyces sp. QL37]PPQ56738.1 hypothetical protein C5F59_08710 [Streptomyces sp. QL37]